MMKNYGQLTRWKEFDQKHRAIVSIWNCIKNENYLGDLKAIQVFRVWKQLEKD